MRIPSAAVLLAAVYFTCILVNSLVTMRLVESQVQLGIDAGSMLRLRVALLSAAVLAPVRDLARVIGWSLFTGLLARLLDERTSWDRIFRVSLTAEVASVLGWTVVGLGSLALRADLFQHQLATIGITSSGTTIGPTGLLGLMLASPGSLLFAAYLGWAMKKRLGWRPLTAVTVVVVLVLLRAAISVYSRAVMIGA